LSRVSSAHADAAVVQFDAAFSAARQVGNAVDEALLSIQMESPLDFQMLEFYLLRQASYFDIAQSIVDLPDADAVCSEFQTWQPPALVDDIDAQAKWRDIANEEHAPFFAAFLRALPSTAEHTNLDTRPGLKEKIGELLDAMLDSPEFRKTCFAIAVEATESCHDRVTLSLSDMSLGLISHRAEQGRYTEKDLMDMGRSLFRLQALDKIALEMVIEQEKKYHENPIAENKVDPIEVRLAYHTKLAEKLALPGIARDMKHEPLANLRVEMISEAARRVGELVDSGADVKYLANWTPWENLMKRRYPQACAQFEERIERDRDWLVFQPPGMNTAQYVAACRDQKAEETSDRARFMVRLTWQHLGGESAGKS